MIQRWVTRLVLCAFCTVLPVSGLFAEPLQIQLPAEPTWFDPLFLEDGAALKIAANTLGTAYFYDGAGERQKGLIDGCSISRNRLQYTCRFKKDLVWSDGKAFHAEQFLLALRRLTGNPVRGALSHLYPPIDMKKTRVLDARAVEIHLREQDEQMLNWMTTPPFAPIRPDLVEHYEKTRSPVLPTLGAYEVVEYRRDSHLLLRKNPRFHASDSVTIPEVMVRFIADEASLYPLMKSGKIDILTRVPTLQQKQVASIASLVEVPVEAVTYLAFNTKKPPFRDRDHRIAVRNAVLIAKRAELAKLLGTGERGAPSFLPTLLAPGGYRREWIITPVKTDPPARFRIQSDSGSRNQTMLEFVQSGIKDELGWVSELELLDWKAHYARLKSDPAAIYRFGWQNPISSASIVYDVLTTDSPNNFTGWSNKEYDALVEELHQEPLLVKRSKLIYEIESILWEEAPVIPLLHQVLRFGVSKRVSGFRANPFGVVLFRELRFEDTPKN